MCFLCCCFRPHHRTQQIQASWRQSRSMKLQSKHKRQIIYLMSHLPLLLNSMIAHSWFLIHLRSIGLLLPSTSPRLPRKIHCSDKFCYKPSVAALPTVNHIQLLLLLLQCQIVHDMNHRASLQCLVCSRLKVAAVVSRMMTTLWSRQQLPLHLLVANLLHPILPTNQMTRFLY